MPNYFLNVRIDWIFEMLQIYGFINREHLMKKFKISMPQASKDLKLASKFFPSMKYNLNTKRYEWEDLNNAEPSNKS